MARICLITPGHLSSNPRLVKEADALADSGHHVFIICGHSFPAYSDELQTFAGHRWSVVARVPFGQLASPWLRLKQRLRQRFCLFLFRLGLRSPFIAVSAWHPASHELIQAARSFQADLYIAHYPPALPAAAIAARTNGGTYGFDAEDFHLGDFPDLDCFTLKRTLLRTLESTWLPRASSVTAASTGIAKAYAKAYGLSEPTVIRNTFPLSHAPLAPSARGTIRPEPTLYWFSQTIGPDRGLECAIHALSLARSRPHLHLRGFIKPSFRKHLVSIATEIDVHDRLHFHLPAPPDQMVRLAAAYDVGLCSETGYTLNRRIALTNKIFTYALAGIPMVLSDIPAHQEIQSEACNAAQLFSLDDPQTLATALDFWFDSPPLVLEAARSASYQLGQQTWNWEHDQLLLVQNVEAILE